MLKCVRILLLILISAVLVGCSGSSTDAFDSPKSPGGKIDDKGACVIRSGKDLAKLYNMDPLEGTTTVDCTLAKDIEINLADDMFPIISKMSEGITRTLDGNGYTVTIVMPKRFNLDDKEVASVGIYDVIRSNTTVKALKIKVVSRRVLSKDNAKDWPKNKEDWPINIYAKSEGSGNTPKSFGFLAGRNEGTIINTALTVLPTVSIFNKYTEYGDTPYDGESDGNGGPVSPLLPPVVIDPPVSPLLPMLPMLPMPMLATVSEPMQASMTIATYDVASDMAETATTSSEPSTTSYNMFGGLVGIASGDSNYLQYNKVVISYELHNIPNDNVIYTHYIGGLVGYVDVAGNDSKSTNLYENNVDFKVRMTDVYIQEETPKYHIYNVGGVAGYGASDIMFDSNIIKSYLYLKQPTVDFNFGSVVGKSEGGILRNKVTSAEYHVKGNKFVANAQGEPVVSANIGGVVGQIVNLFNPEGTDGNVYNISRKVSENYIVNMLVNLDPEDTSLRIGGIVGLSYDGLIINNLADKVSFKAKTLEGTPIPPFSLPGDTSLKILSKNAYLGGVIGYYDTSEELSKSGLAYAITNIVSGDMLINKNEFAGEDKPVEFMHALNFGGIVGYEKMNQDETDSNYYSSIERNVAIFNTIYASDALTSANSPIDTYSVNRVIGVVDDVDNSNIRRATSFITTENFVLDGVFKVKYNGIDYNIDNNAANTTNYDTYLQKYPLLMGVNKSSVDLHSKIFWGDTVYLNHLSNTSAVSVWAIVDGKLPTLQYFSGSN